MAGNIALYNRKRNFGITPEPAGKSTGARGAGAFVIQKHAASRLHYDFRLEWDGVLKSWAVPKGPSLDPAVKRMAVQVEDHPVSYGEFEGMIPRGQYGAGSVLLWDRGRWEPIGDAARGLREGKLKFRLDGEKLHGGFTLVRLRGTEQDKQPAWLLIKEKDEHARVTAEFDVLELGESVKKKRGGTAGKAVKARATEKAAHSTPRTGRKAVPGRGAKAQSARKRGVLPLPPLLSPQLATLVTEPPTHGDWEYELKLDGYRLLTRVDGSQVRCFTRNGNDWTSRVQRVAEAVAALDLPPCWLDGELVALDSKGVPDFQRLQNAFEQHSTADLRYIVFDLLFAEGEDLRPVPQRERRDRLRTLLKGARGTVQFSETLEDQPKRLLAAARAAGFEGIMGKRTDAPYATGRSSYWIKLKVGLRQEFVIGGYTDPQGSRSGLGSLLLGVYDKEGALRYVGSVGSGFDQQTLDAVHAKLARLEQPRSPFEGGPAKVGTVRRAVPHWVKPNLVAEVSFAAWTEGGHVRHAVFNGLREDKPPRQITLEKARPPVVAETEQQMAKGAKRGTAAPARARARRTTAAPKRVATAKATALPADFRVTHPERVIDASTGLTKGDLVAYYAAVAPHALPHFERRPVALLRAPEGVDGEKFFQKHAEARSIPDLDQLPPGLDPDHKRMLAISTPRALLSAAQMNVIELHTWNATTRAIEKPDRVIFDLDPGENVTWQAVVEGTRLMHALLEELDLASFVKTSGGKGLHVVVPLKPSLGWDETKQFSGDLVRHMSQVLPQRFVAKSGPKNRVGRIFIDFLRNGRGATTVAAWSARARPGMGISVPIGWDELDDLPEPPIWTVGNFADRLKIGNRPWKKYEESRQTLRNAMKLFGKVSAA